MFFCDSARSPHRTTKPSRGQLRVVGLKATTRFCPCKRRGSKVINEKPKLRRGCARCVPTHAKNVRMDPGGARRADTQSGRVYARRRGPTGVCVYDEPQPSWEAWLVWPAVKPRTSIFLPGFPWDLTRTKPAVARSRCFKPDSKW